MLYRGFTVYLISLIANVCTWKSQCKVPFFIWFWVSENQTTSRHKFAIAMPQIKYRSTDVFDRFLQQSSVAQWVKHYTVDLKAGVQFLPQVLFFISNLLRQEEQIQGWFWSFKVMRTNLGNLHRRPDNQQKPNSAPLFSLPDPIHTNNRAMQASVIPNTVWWRTKHDLSHTQPLALVAVHRPSSSNSQSP
jgi:hypothetical protein